MFLEAQRSAGVGVEITDARVAEEISGWAVEDSGAKRAKVALGIVP